MDGRRRRMVALIVAGAAFLSSVGLSVRSGTGDEGVPDRPWAGEVALLKRELATCRQQIADLRKEIADLRKQVGHMRETLGQPVGSVTAPTPADVRKHIDTLKHGDRFDRRKACHSLAGMGDKAFAAVPQLLKTIGGERTEGEPVRPPVGNHASAGRGVGPRARRPIAPRPGR